MQAMRSMGEVLRRRRDGASPRAAISAVGLRLSAAFGDDAALRVELEGEPSRVEFHRDHVARTHDAQPLGTRALAGVLAERAVERLADRELSCLRVAFLRDEHRRRRGLGHLGRFDGATGRECGDGDGCKAHEGESEHRAIVPACEIHFARPKHFTYRRLGGRPQNSLTQERQEDPMHIETRKIIQKIVVAVTLGVAAVATWAVTDTSPAVEIAQSSGHQG
jgi:hypothetical protein